MSGISRFTWKVVFSRRRRLGVGSVGMLSCAGAVGLAAALFFATAPASAEETCQQREATCDDPKGGPACCAWACRNRNKCDDCCRGGFPSMGEDFDKCKRECREKFPKKNEEMEPPSEPADP